MLTLVLGQGEHPSPETKHHGNFTDSLHWFPGAPRKYVFHHSLAGAALVLQCARYGTDSGYCPFLD